MNTKMLSQFPSIGLQTRIRALKKHMRELQVTPEQLQAFLVAENAIETTNEMIQDDPEVQMPGTTEAYVEAEQEDLVLAADRWLSFLLEA